uniref:MFS domain-containing protein n=1 Tax=Steinernema glaseri TaxID=37863 RepID=A0A1I8A8K2_9BILA
MEIQHKAQAGQEGELTIALLIAVVVVTVGSSFQFGYHIGCVNAPGEMITKWFIESQYALTGATITKETADFYWSVSVSLFAVGGMIGGLMSGKVADKFGRRGALLINNVIAIAAAIFMTSAKYANIWYLIPIGRLIIGLNCGLNSGIVPMYLTEVSPINLRGMIGSVHQLLVTISILVSQIFGLPYLLGSEARWPFIFAFTVVPAAFQLIAINLCPESPKYTLIQKNNVDRAEADLKKLRGKENVSAELDTMRDEVEASRLQPQVSMADMFKSPLAWPLFIAAMMMLSQQLSGINVAMFYSTEIFRGAGLTGVAPFYATIGMGTVNVLQTIVSLWLVDHPKFGRRSLHIIGLTGMLVSSIFIVISLSLFESGKVFDADGKLVDVPNERQWASSMAIIFVLLFVISFATGPGSIPWFFVSEIFASSARGNANSIAVLVNWAANFAVGLFFLPLNNLLHQYSFLVFVGFLAIFIVFTSKWVPETKGKTIEDINKELSRKN